MIDCGTVSLRLSNPAKRDFGVIGVASEATADGFEVTCVAFEVTRVGLEATADASEVTRVGFKVTCDGSEVTYVASEVTAVTSEATRFGLEATLPGKVPEADDAEATADTGKPETADTTPGSVPAKVGCFVTSRFTVGGEVNAKNRPAHQVRRQSDRMNRNFSMSIWRSCYLFMLVQKHRHFDKCIK